jgi:hypothetical protein
MFYNIGSRMERLARSNKLEGLYIQAYLTSFSVTKKKSLITVAPVAFIIIIFSIVVITIVW